MLCFGERGPSPMIGGKRRRGCRSLRHSTQKGENTKGGRMFLGRGRDGRSKSKSVDLEIPQNKSRERKKRRQPTKSKTRDISIYLLIVSIVDCGD